MAELIFPNVEGTLTQLTGKELSPTLFVSDLGQYAISGTTREGRGGSRREIDVAAACFELVDQFDYASLPPLTYLTDTKNRSIAGYLSTSPVATQFLAEKESKIRRVIASNVDGIVDFDIDDIYQIFALKFLHLFGSFRGDSSLDTWACDIAISTGIDWIKARSARNKREDLLDTFDMVVVDTNFEDEIIDSLTANQPDPLYFNIIDSLKDKERSVCLLRIMGFTNAQVAQLLGIEFGNAKKRFSLATQFIQHALHISAPDLIEAGSGRVKKTGGKGDVLLI